ncbi:hybrid sensor histidine kinase/response regulator transcription factor [Bacteroides sp.]
MKNQYPSLQGLFCTVLLVLFTGILRAEGSFKSFKFRQLTTSDGLPTNDVQQVYQDEEGYIWMATRNGLAQYDGYEMKVYKSNIYNWNLLGNNNISCITEDTEHRLWIGTYDGLNVLDKTTGKIKQINKSEFSNNAISQILVTRKGQILLGTDLGLYQYIPERDSCVLFTRETTKNVMPQTSVKSLLEDSKGNIWIGTWNEGLYRYDPEEGRYYAYPKMNERKSAHVIFEDSHHQIWVGAWEGGLALLENPYDMKLVSWKTFRHNSNVGGSLADDVIYAISEDRNTNSLWVGTRSGLSVLPYGASSFINYYPGESEHSISGNEVTSMICDKQGMMWLSMIGGGVNAVITRELNFALDRLEGIRKTFKTNSVRSMLVDDEGLVWLGIGTYELVLYDPKTGGWQDMHQLGFPDTGSTIYSIYSIMQSPTTGKIWIGTYDGGLYVYDKKAKADERVKRYREYNTPWLPNDRLYDIREDSKGRTWFATRYGFSMLTANGDICRFDLLDMAGENLHSMIAMDIEEGVDGEIWIGTENMGVVRVVGDGNNVRNYKLYSYAPKNKKLNSVKVMCMYKDELGRIWAGTEGCGLNLYDPTTDKFLPVHAQWNLPGDAMFSIIGDKNNNLWMGTNVGLLRLYVPKDLVGVSYRLYTTADGMQDNIFARNVACMTKEGEMFFGGPRGYNHFFPDRLKESDFFPSITITDIKIFDQSWGKLEESERKKISKQSPDFTKKIVLDCWHNNFSIEFAVLDYMNSAQNKYSYKLDGFDTNWQYPDMSRRFAYYNNLPAGTYTFRLKAANSNGVWGERKSTLEVVILPPPWRMWWAYVIYVILVASAGYVLFRMGKKRVQLHNALHLRELEKAKAEELNHTKLQFFTNITHELLTPLTIISATVDELKVCAPQNGEYYQIMTGNINRLIRLLQQILEFRKAETGNLKLRVSKGDLAAFVRNCVDNFKPLMKKKKMYFSIITTPEPFMAYFDSDKIDKVLYNLLSNASKYNKEGGTVWVDLSYEKTLDAAVLIVKDNGEGISKEAQRSLFKRFYEGDYRKFNTIGTGIGLSLTKDLVELHQGSISVQSELGKGTEFKVVIPVNRNAYKEEEVDDKSEMLPVAQHIPIEEVEEGHAKEEEENSKEHTLLLVEDNEDLLQLMTKLLKSDYNVYTACTGKEGIAIIESQDVDLIVSDIMMPEMDGLEFCRYVKGHFDTSHIPVILLTAKNQEEDRVEAYEAGAEAFISKPFNLSVLHARISNLLKTRERTNKDFKKQLVFEVGELNYTSIDEEFLQKAVDCIQSHLDDSTYDQTKFVDEMGVSKSTLFRKLKSLTGFTYSSFVRNIRMKTACRIMEEKRNVRISELAYAVGFNDPKYFSACFKKELGMHPSEYMERFVTGEKPEDAAMEEN